MRSIEDVQTYSQALQPDLLVLPMLVVVLVQALFRGELYAVIEY